jgi:hypothetical protein
MAPDDIMVYTATAIVPAVTALASVPAAHAVHRRSMSLLSACLLFVATVICGMFLSFAVVSRFSYLLHGDGALAIVAAPVTGAILTVPVALAFGVALTVIVSRRKRSSSKA